MLLALAVQYKMHLHQMDVVSAYLNSDLNDEIYMRQPQCFIEEESEEKVLRLNKAIYGLKQSGREWNATLDGVLKSIDFKALESEPCLYKARRNSVLVIVAVTVTK